MWGEAQWPRNKPGAVFSHQRDPTIDLGPSGQEFFTGTWTLSWKKDHIDIIEILLAILIVDDFGPGQLHTQ